MKTERSFLNSIKWAYTANWGERAFSAVFMFILAALVGPRDFGVISIALTYILFLQMFLDQGLAAAIIQRKDLEPDHLDAVFWMDLGLSLILVLLSILFSHWWAKVNRAPEAASIISAISVCIVIEALSVVQTSILRRNMDFKSLSIRTNASVVLSGIVGVTMALAGFRVWALVGQQIARDLIALVLLWRLSPWRPRFEFSWRHLRELMGFSIPNFTARLANFADGQASSILLGLFFGPLALGLYRIAERFVNCVVVMATSSIQAVSLPEFSRLQGNPRQLRESALSCVHLSASLTLPALAGLAAVSTSLMGSMGGQWGPASDVLKVLSATGMCIIFAYFTGPLLQATGRTHQLAILEWTRTAIGVLAIAGVGIAVRHSSVRSQILGIGFARLVPSALIITPVFLYILMRLAGISFGSLISSISPALAAASSVAGTVAIVRLLHVLSSTKPIVGLLVESSIGGIVGAATLLTLDPQLRLAVARTIMRNRPRLVSVPAE
jgi:teichuronic acid exporter